MDSLLEKLRAAAPQARDQRDRRRRARLKERHQVRVTSGQQVPELPDPGEDKENTGENEGADASNNESDLLSPETQGDDGASPSGQETQVSESEDVADRAANMLQGLRGDGEGGGERARRRRESADDERRNRRMRRRTAQTGSKDSGDGSNLPSLKELDSKPDADDSALMSPDDPDGSFPSSTMPSIVVSSTGDGGD